MNEEYRIDNPLVRKRDAAQLCWLGHVTPMANKCLVKVVYDKEIDGARLRGRHIVVFMIESDFKGGMSDTLV